MSNKFPHFPDDFRDLDEGMGPPRFTTTILGFLGFFVLLCCVVFGIQLLAGYVTYLSAVPACSFPLPEN